MTAASARAGASSALELYPRSLDPLRALRLVRQSLATSAELTEDDVRNRVHARFPLVDLPSRPRLDELLFDAEVAVTWRSRAGHRGDLRAG